MSEKETAEGAMWARSATGQQSHAERLANVNMGYRGAAQETAEAWDRRMYGHSFTLNGERIDPLRVSVSGPGECLMQSNDPRPQVEWPHHGSAGRLLAVRLAALKAAATCGAGAEPEAVLRAARLFEAYLTGDNAP